MSQHHPYEVTCVPYVQNDLPSQMSLAGVTKAFSIWGGVFILTFSVLIFVRFDKPSQRLSIELPSHQDLSFYVAIGGIFVVGSILSWGLGCIADGAGRSRLFLSKAAISILLIILAAPGLISLHHYGICWNAFSKTIMFLLPTIAYTSSRTKRWTRRARSTGFDLR